MSAAGSRRIPIDPGLHVLRYVRSGHDGAGCSVQVQAVGQGARHIQILTPPQVAIGEIGGPGGSVVVRAEQAGELEVTVQSRAAGGRGSDDAVELQLETLTSGRSMVAGRSEIGSRLASAEVAAKPHLELVGHVSRRGDVRRSDGEWLAGPDAPAPIEGMQARLVGGPLGLKVAYQVLSGAPNAVWSAWFEDGAFAGSRGQFLSLSGVRFRLSGMEASRFEIRGEALFLGATVQSAKGGEIELVSASKIDPLVGLKVALSNSISTRENMARMASSSDEKGQESRSGRVRVFRAAKVG